MAADPFATRSTRRIAALRSRTPGMVNGAIVLILLFIIVPLTLHVAQNPPPSIAEFSPQVQQQIKQAPSEQGSGPGQGQGAPAGGFAATPTPAPTPTSTQVIDTARVLHCVGDPPRQIEDPQSPPCVAYWQGNNGGATSKGVSSDNTIYVAQPTATCNQACSSTCGTATSCGTDQDLQQFFNTRFELYGRHIQLVRAGDWFSDQGATSTSCSPAAERAAAQTANGFPYKGGTGVFASMEGNTGCGSDYEDQLATYQIIASEGNPDFSESYLATRAPYLWEYQMSWDAQEQLLGSWYCRRLAGGDAVHAKGNDGQTPPQSMSQDKRVLGVVMTTEDDFPVSDQPLKDELATCGAKVSWDDVDEIYSDSNNPQARLQDVEKMKVAGVTTVVALGNVYDLRTLGQAASSQNWYPEWVVSSYLNIAENAAWKTQGLPADQRVDAFGLTMQPMQVPPNDNPSNWAHKDVDSGPGAQYKGSLPQASTDLDYRAMLLIAAGIQMAGPDLTPQSFAAGLQSARFPNPFTPLMAGHVGFNAGNHYMTIDAAETWWSDSAQSPYPDEGAGSWCYVDGGARHSMSDPFPQGGDPFFGNNPCDSGVGH